MTTSAPKNIGKRVDVVIDPYEQIFNLPNKWEFDERRNDTELIFYR